MTMVTSSLTMVMVPFPAAAAPDTPAEASVAA